MFKHISLTSGINTFWIVFNNESTINIAKYCTKERKQTKKMTLDVSTLCNKIGVKFASDVCDNASYQF